MRAFGTKGPSKIRLLVGLAATAACLAFPGMALAAAPEVPELKVEHVWASTAVFDGTLSPSATEPNEGGTYQFIYRAGTPCKGAGEKVAPASPGLSLGQPAEPVSEPLSGLTPNTQYTVCLSITNLTSETSVSPGVSFKTTKAAKPEAPEAGEAVERRATTATLTGVVNPLAEGEPGHYRFLYRQSASQCTGAGEVQTAEEAASGESPQSVFAEIGSLEAGKPYTFCLKAVNALGESTLSAPKTFTTAIPPEAPITEPATEVTSSTATFNGTLNPTSPGEAGTYQFLYNQGPSCEGGSATPPQPSTVASPQPVSAKVSGLHPGAPYTVCLRAENRAEEFAVGAPQSLTLTPSVEDEEATELTKSSATLNAKINPDGAAITECSFQYGTTTGYGHALPCEPASLASGTTPLPVAAHLGLEDDNTEYHWRLIATSTAGTTTTPDQTFIYPVTTASESCANAQLRIENNSTALPDCRAYELVTPAQKNGGLIGAAFIGTIPPSIADDGSRMIAQSLECFGDPESCVSARQSEGEPYEFQRTPAGWVTQPLAPPVSTETDSWWAFDASAGTAMFSVPSVPGTSATDDFYGRTATGEFLDLGPFAESVVGSHGEIGTELEPEGLLATSDLSHVVYETSESEWAFDPYGRRLSLYEYVGTRNEAPLVVGVKGGYGSHAPVSNCNIGLGVGAQRGTDHRYNSLSEDGRIVYFSAEGRSDGAFCKTQSASTAPPAWEAYARVDGEIPGKARTAILSAPTPGSCTEASCVKNTTVESEARDAAFEGASTDGSKAFFTDTQQLTDGASEDANVKKAAAPILAADVTRSRKRAAATCMSRSANTARK